MVTIPHDVPDLYLAPVLLALSARIDELATLEPAELDKTIALLSDKADWTHELREAALLEAIRHNTECHHWELSVDPRGLRVSHGEHNVVLGIPATFAAFLNGPVSA